VRLGAGGRGTGQSRLAGGQLAVDPDPPLARCVIERDRPVRATETQREAHIVADLGEPVVVDRAAERQEL
jgi:hypothetical protein